VNFWARSLRPPLLAQKLAGGPVDEMQAAAGLTHNGFIGALWFFGRDPVGLPMHVHARQGAFENLKMK
jgi:hypothetical protein